MLSNVYLNVLLYFIGTVSSKTLNDLILSNDEEIGCPSERPCDLDVPEIVAYYFNYATKCNAVYSMKDAPARIKAREDFDPDQCIHVYVPGFNENITAVSSKEMQCALANYKCNSKNIVLIIIDHSKYTSGDPTKEDVFVSYRRTMKYSVSVSYAIGRMFAEILQCILRENFFVFGYRIGGHIAGTAAEHCDSLGYRVPLIFSIEPGAPCYRDFIEYHVQSGQADTVVVIHCNAGLIGSSYNLADYDVYSYDGVNQKGCKGGDSEDPDVRVKAGFCSHYKCVSIAMQTVLRDGIWKATKCDTFKNYIGGKCSANEKTIIAYNKRPSTSCGVYFFNPYCDLKCELPR